MEDRASLKDMLDHVERYFALHASQRIALFNFFVVVSGALGAALAASLQLSKLFNLVGVALGILLAVVSFVFWKLDQRTAFLVKHAEDAMKELESELPEVAARVFSLEPNRTDITTKGALAPFFRMWTYGRAFRLIFFAMGFAGVAGTVLAFGQYREWWAF